MLFSYAFRHKNTLKYENKLKNAIQSIAIPLTFDYLCISERKTGD